MTTQIFENYSKFLNREDKSESIEIDLFDGDRIVLGGSAQKYEQLLKEIEKANQ